MLTIYYAGTAGNTTPRPGTSFCSLYFIENLVLKQRYILTSLPFENFKARLGTTLKILATSKKI